MSTKEFWDWNKFCDLTQVFNELAEVDIYEELMDYVDDYNEFYAIGPDLATYLRENGETIIKDYLTFEDVWCKKSPKEIKPWEDEIIISASVNV